MGPKAKIRRKFPNFILQNLEKQIAPCEHTTREDLVHRLKSKSHLKKTASLTLAVKGLMNHQSLPSSHSCSGTLCPVFIVCVFFLSFSLSSVSLFRKICYPIAVTWRRTGAQRGRKKLRFRN